MSRNRHGGNRRPKVEIIYNNIGAVKLPKLTANLKTEYSDELQRRHLP